MNVFDLVAKLTLDSSEYDHGLDDSERKASSFGNKLKSGIGTAGKVVASAVATATAAVGAFAAKSVEAGKSFDASMSQVAATMGFTVEELNTEGSEAAKTIETLSNFAQDMGSTTAFSASQAADALNYMALAGYDAETSMAMLPNVLNLAAAGGMDLATASDMVTDASSALGLSIEETAVMVDQMAKASSKSNTSVSQLGEAFLTIGGTAKNLVGGTTELSTALGILADNGVKGAEGGTALRNILLNLTPKSDDAAAAMERIGLNAYTSTGEMRPLADIFRDMNDQLGTMSTQERQNVLGDIFNKVDLKSVNALLAASGDKVGAVSVALEDSGIAWDKYSDSAWAAGTNISDGVIDDLLYNIEELGTSAEELRDYLHFEYDIDYEDADKAISAVTKSIEEISSQSDRWDELTASINDASGAAQAMADVQLDNLAGDITLFKSALEGAQIAVSDQLTPSIREFVQFGTEGLSQLTAAFREGGLSGAMDAFGQILSDGLEMIISMLPKMVEAGMQLLDALIDGIISNLPTLIKAAVDIVKSLTEYIVNNLPKLLDAAIEIIFTIADGIIDAIPDLIPAIVEVILTIVDKLTEPSTLMKMIDSAFKIIGAVAEGLIKAIPKLVEKVPTIIANLIEAILRFLPQLLASGTKLIVNMALGIVQGGVELVRSVVQVITNAKDSIMERVHDAANWGRDLIQNFIDGILEKWRSLKETVSNVAQTVRDFLGFSEPKKGPLSNFHTYAPDMMEMFAQGIKDNEKLVSAQLNSSLSFPDNELGFSGSSASYAGSTFNINVYGAEGQDEQKLVDILIDEITRRTEREKVAFA